MRPALPDGWTVRFTHLRHPLMHRADRFGGPQLRKNKDVLLTLGELKKNGLQPAPTGGSTICRILDAEGNVVAGGNAFCCERDNYSRRLGRVISQGRALKDLAARYHKLADA